MKRTYILTLLLTLASLCIKAQEKDIFADIADMKGVTTVYISKAMLSLVPKVEADGVNFANLIGKLESVQILSTDNAEALTAVRKKTRHITPANGYEELLRIKEDGNQTHIYMKQTPRMPNEFVLLTEESDEFTVIIITGNVTLEEMQQAMEASPTDDINKE